MSEPFTLMLDTTIHPGKLQEAESIVSSLVVDVESSDSGLLSYAAYTDQTTLRCCILDTYASSEAFLNHLARPTVGHALSRLMAISDTNVLTVLGYPSASAREALEAMGATFVTKVAGYAKPGLIAA